jgi:hypothetical protein
MTSHKGLNLLLSEAFANAISFGLSKAGNRIVNTLAGTPGAVGSALTRIVKLGAREGAEQAGLLARAWARVASRSTVLERLTEKIGEHAALQIAGRLAKGYFDLLGEVIFEMAFDNMLRFNKDERPMGGGETFLITMSVSVVVSGLLQSVGSGLDTGSKKSWSEISVNQKAARVTVRTLLMTSLALAVSMYAMRMPVMEASSA